MEGFNKNQITSGVFFDCSKAFDTVWHDGLLWKLREKAKLSRPAIRWIASYLQDRTLSVRIGSTLSKEVPLSAGTPQGGVISPVLFIIFINDWTEGLPDSIQASQFADDLAIWRTGRINHGKDWEDHVRDMEAGIQSIQDYCKCWFLKLNEGKTNLMNFSHRDWRVHGGIKPCIRMGDKVLEPSKEVSFLGVTLTPKLDWRVHHERTLASARKKLNALRWLSGSPGITPKTILKLWKMYIEPAVLYGCQLTTLGRHRDVHSIQVLQNQAIRLAFRLPKWALATWARSLTPMDTIEDVCIARRASYLNGGKQILIPGRPRNKMMRRRYGHLYGGA